MLYFGEVHDNADALENELSIYIFLRVMQLYPFFQETAVFNNSIINNLEMMSIQIIDTVEHVYGVFMLLMPITLTWINALTGHQ
jgi:hypothetical protein